jgi:hypothetical protein
MKIFTHSISEFLEDLNNKIACLSKWIQEKTPHVIDEQTHLNDETEEQAYWHYGYLSALKDIQKKFDKF